MILESESDEEDEDKFNEELEEEQKGNYKKADTKSKEKGRFQLLPPFFNAFALALAT